MAHLSAAKVSCSIILLAGTANAQFGGFGGFGPPGGTGNPNDSSQNGDGSDSDGPFSSSNSQNFGYSSSAAFRQTNRILIAHAVMASLVWVVLMPTGAILMRLKTSGVSSVKLHAVWQIFSFLIYVVAAAMGIWLVQQGARSTDFWNDPHPKLGVAILVIAFFQPIWGYIHHRLYKQHAKDVRDGRNTNVPGRTVVGRIHLWIGRGLIVSGMINGGLGIRLASKSPFLTDATTRKAKIAYAVIAASIFLLYALVTVSYEIRQRRTQQTFDQRAGREDIMMKDDLPSYDESQESLQGGQRR